jgi:cell wall-associated NlpC family hydrolase
MEEKIAKVINSIILENSDQRTHLFNVQVKSIDERRLALSGEVLDGDTLAKAEHMLKGEFPEVNLDTTVVKVLRSGSYVWCATNFTSMHAEPSWLAEQVTQSAYGVRLEVLKNEENWSFVRQDDGYLAWIYRPYCSIVRPETPTHIVSALVGGLFKEPSKDSLHLSRLYTGTFAAVENWQGEWARIAPHKEQTPNSISGGWMHKERLLAIVDFPGTEEKKRKAILDEAFRMVGVPYLWGGTSTNGIDCSGLAQLCHRLAGLNILRDADMQKNAGRKVEPPFKPGDLVFFGDEGNLDRITHVGISLGGWEIIHSSRSRNGVNTDNIQQVPHLKDTFAGGCTYL